jgi:hypothetical protein
MLTRNSKAKIREILKNLKCRNDTRTFNLLYLETNITNIYQFNSLLLPENALFILKQLKENSKSISNKIVRLNEIIQMLHKILSKKASQISNVIVEESEELCKEYNNVDSEIADYRKNYNDIRKKIQEILSVNGSEISDFIEIHNSMGI